MASSSTGFTNCPSDLAGAFSDGGPSVIRKTLEGWQFSGVARIQSGTPTRHPQWTGRLSITATPASCSHNMTQKQLQDMVKIRKTSVCNPYGACQGVVYWLPQDVIDNTLAAFELGGKTLANLDPTKPYIGPPTTAGAAWRECLRLRAVDLAL